MSEPHRFPPVERCREDGLLMVGGRLDTDWLLDAYQHGIFPWPLVGGGRAMLAWFSPDPRAVLDLDRLHVPHRLQRRIRRGEFAFTVDRDFTTVVAACAAPRGDGEGSWITAELAAAYRDLHEQGHAHSVEVWSAEELVGGLYGVALGGFFAGESMFSRRRDASKAGLVYLVERLRERGYRLFDVQQSSPHLRQLGASEIPRAAYLRRLHEATGLPVTFS